MGLKNRTSSPGGHPVRRSSHFSHRSLAPVGLGHLEGWRKGPKGGTGDQLCHGEVLVGFGFFSLVNNNMDCWEKITMFIHVLHVKSMVNPGFHDGAGMSWSPTDDNG